MVENIKEIHIINVVWNTDYATDFLEYSLPSLLTSGNIPYLKNKIKTSFKIYTDNSTRTFIENHPNYKKLSLLLDSKVIAIDLLSRLDKYEKMTQYYSFGFQEANKRNAGFIILSSDWIVSSNSFKNLYTHILENKRAIFTSSLRICSSYFIRYFKRFYNSPDSLECFLSSRNLLKINFKKLHPEVKNLTLPNKNLPIWLSNVYWKINKNVLLNRAFHMHPLFLWPQNKNISLVDNTYDREFPFLCCPDINTWKIIEDSDEILTLGLTKDNEFSKQVLKNTSMTFAKWLVNNNKHYHLNLHLFKHRILFHCNDLDINLLQHTFTNSDCLVSSIKNIIKSKSYKIKSIDLINIVSKTKFLYNSLTFFFP